MSSDRQQRSCPRIRTTCTGACAGSASLQGAGTALATFHADRDAAATCTKALRLRLAQLPSHVLASDWCCSLHQLHICERAVLRQRRGLLAFTHSAALLCRMGGYLLRLSQADPSLAVIRVQSTFEMHL